MPFAPPPQLANAPGKHTAAPAISSARKKSRRFRPRSSCCARTQPHTR